MNKGKLHGYGMMSLENKGHVDGLFENGEYKEESKMIKLF